MESFLHFFETMPTWQKAAWIAFCIMLNMFGEATFPFRSLSYKKWKHAGVNLSFLLPIFIINILFGIFTAGIYGWLEGKSWGVFGLFDAPVWVQLLLAVLIFDLVGQYLIHVILHKYKWLWKMHLVHHSDTKVDATSATRLHPGDYLLREIGALVVILITAVPFSYYVFYRMLTIFFTYFTHANIHLPGWLDKFLSVFIVTPTMHKFHHHFERPWTDSNFGNIFSIWDRLFGTFVYSNPKDIRYGVDVLDDATDEDLGYQLKLPFNSKVKTDY